jgi:type I restriction enzyme S subunit
MSSGWASAILNDVADILDFEREPVNSAERDARIAGKKESELFPYYGATGKVGLIDNYRTEGERVLLGEDAAPFLDPLKDKAYLATGRFWVNNHAHVLKGAGGLIDNRFLCYQLNVIDYHDAVTGSTRLKLTSAAMRQLPLKVAPLGEQIRIVSKIEELLSDLDAGVAELKSAQKKLAQYRQSLLKAAMEGALTADWRAKQTPAETGAQLQGRIHTERRVRWEATQLAKFEEQGKTPPRDWKKKYPEPVSPDTTGLPELPGGWVWSSLDALICEGPQNGLYLPSTRYGSGIPILRIDDYQIDWHRSRQDLNRVAADDFMVPVYALKQGDIVINRVNSMTHLGKSLLIGEALDGALFESNMMRLSISAAAAGQFVTYYLGSDVGRARLIHDAKWAVNQASVNQQDVRRTPIPLPPVTEQSLIVQALSVQLEAAEAQSKAIAIALKQATAQRQNILRTAFAGQLVPQDPNDEPATLLMERIRAEKAEREKQPKARKTQKQREIAAVVSKLIDVLAEAGDWVSAQEAFQRCGVADGAETDQVEALYSELRALDKAGRLAVEAVTDTHGRKLHDRLKLLAI